MVRYKRGVRARRRSYDPCMDGDVPDPYDDAYETPEGFIGAILDGAGGGDQSKHRRRRR